MRAPQSNAGYYRLPLIAALLVSIAIGLVAFIYYEYYEETKSVHNSLVMEKNLADLLSHVQNAETGTRGFMLTGNETYLEIYYHGLQEAPKLFDTLESQMASDPELYRRLRELEPVIERRLALLRDGIDIRRTLGLAAAIKFVQSNQGRNAMLLVRDGIAQLQRMENQSQTDRTHKISNLIRIGVFSAIGALILILSSILGWIWTVRRDQQLLDKERLEREAAEDKMRQMQKMEAIGQLTGGIAHDFNNMLAVVISGLSIIKRRLNADHPDLLEIVDATIAGTHRAATLTNRLMSFARQQPLDPKPVNAKSMIQDMTDLIARSIGETIRIDFHFSPDLWPLYADAHQLENALLNLCVNSRDAMPHGGKLTIEAINVEINTRLAKQFDIPDGDYVSIMVSDTGEGMSQDVIDHVFEPFFTTKAPGKGTGLGLSQVHGFIKQSNGHIKIYSEPGQGTTIKLYLPRFENQFEILDVPKAVINPDIFDTSPVILVVEDDDQVRVSTVAMVKELGYEVHEANSGMAALQQLEKYPNIALLFTDIVMPEMNGRELAVEAQKRWPALKVLYTTGFSRNALVHDGKLEANVQLLPKPFTFEQLAAKLNQLFPGTGIQKTLRRQSNF